MYTKNSIAIGASISDFTDLDPAIAVRVGYPIRYFRSLIPGPSATREDQVLAVIDFINRTSLDAGVLVVHENGDHAVDVCRVAVALTLKVGQNCSIVTISGGWDRKLGRQNYEINSDYFTRSDISLC